MGSGASKPLTIEERMTMDVPVEFGDLNVAGEIECRNEYLGGKPAYYRRSYDTTGGIMNQYLSYSPSNKVNLSSPSPSPQSKKSPKGIGDGSPDGIGTAFGSPSNQRKSQLELQAESNWHRILEHAREQIDTGQFQRPQCPECTRGSWTSDTCGICKADVTEARKLPRPSPPTSDTNSQYKPYSLFSPQVRWNEETQSYDRIYVSRDLTGAFYSEYEGNDGVGVSGGDDSVDYGSYDNKEAIHDEREDDDIYRKRETVVGDHDHDAVQMLKLIEVLQENEKKKRPKSSKAVHSNEDMEQIQKELDKLRKDEEEEAKTKELEAKRKKRIEERLLNERQSLLETLRGVLNRAANYNNNKDTNRRKGRGKKKHQQRQSDKLDQKLMIPEHSRSKSTSNGPSGKRDASFHPRNDSEDHDDSDEYDDGEDDDDDDDDEDDDDESVDYEGPDVDLPDVQIELKARTSTSITLTWDINSDALLAFQKMDALYDGRKIPTYEIMYRSHVVKKGDSSSSQWSFAGPRTKEKTTTLQNLSSNTPYVFRCRRLGWGDWGPSVVIRTGPGVPSSSKISAKEVSSSSILVTWQVPDKDNGLPVNEYRLQMKVWGGEFKEVYRGRERLFLATNLAPNIIHVFEVVALNKVGPGPASERLAVRTLQNGAAEMTPWVEALDETTGKLFYRHPRTNATAWILPKGALVDEAGSLKNKRYFLQQQAQYRAREACEGLGVLHHVCQISIKRGNLLEDSLQAVYRIPTLELNAGPIRVRYDGEEGVDAGGLAKDWFTEVSRGLIEGSTGLLQVNSEGFVSLDVRACAIHKPSEARWLFKALGIFLAKALVDNHTLGFTFSKTILMLLSGKSPQLEDLKEDGAFYKGLKWVENNDVTDADLTFSASYELFGSTETVDLIDGGRSESVTEENKHEYIELMTAWLTRKRFEPCISYLIEGFSRHVPTKDLLHIHPSELQIILGGQNTVDVNDLKKGVEFQGGFTNESPQVIWLWQALENFDQESLSKFLGFVTGCPYLPVDGLSPPLLITLTPESDMILPKAHTCFNQIVIPEYSSFDVLNERLEYALKNVEMGFHMA